jgi:CRISPR/Cas system-associated endonuclease Cas1
MPELYASTPGAVIRLTDGLISVERGKRVLGAIPIETVESAYLLAGVGITRGAQDALVARGAPIVFVT